MSLSLGFIDTQLKTFVKIRFLCWPLRQCSDRSRREPSSLKTSVLSPSPLFSLWWTALDNPRESFTWYYEDSLTYIVFVYWIIKEKKTKAPSRLLNIVQFMNWIKCLNSIAFLVWLNCNEMVLKLRADGTSVFVLCCFFLGNRKTFKSCKIQSQGGERFLNVKPSGAEALCSSACLLGSGGSGLVHGRKGKRVWLI